MSVMSLTDIAKALGGEASRGMVLAPGPGHSRRDRSLSVKLSVNSPDGFLVFSHAGDDFRDCRDHVRARLGLPDDSWRTHKPAPIRAALSPDSTDETRIARAVAIWNEGRDPRDTIVARYLVGRGLVLDDDVAGAALRFHPACPWRDEERQQTIKVPAMLAAMRQVDGNRITAVHRTRLDAEGRKIDRRMLGIAAGAAIKLDADDTVTAGLAIGEGIETCLAGRQLGFRPTWALASAGAIAAFPVLPGVDALTLFLERDQASDRATSECGERWHEAGRDVVLVEPKAGNDLNDTIKGDE